MAHSEEITLAEAHLYVGIAKADGVVSQDEYAQIPYYATKSQRFYDMMKMNKETASRIGPAIRELLCNKEIQKWNSDEHLAEAVKLLRSARDKGFWQAQVTYQKNEEGFLEAAKIGGYVIKESRFIEKIAAAIM